MRFVGEKLKRSPAAGSFLLWALSEPTIAQSANTAPTLSASAAKTRQALTSRPTNQDMHAARFGTFGVGSVTCITGSPREGSPTMDRLGVAFCSFPSFFWSCVFSA